MRQIEPSELAAWLAEATRKKPVLLDVREKWEYAYCCIPDSQLVPMGEIPQRYDELDPETDVVVICHHGVRSYRIAMLLEHNGFTRVYNLTGGVERWARDVDPAMPRY